MDPEVLSEREMPHSVEAEQTVLGAVLVDPEELPRVMEHLRSESFYVKSHRELFNVIVRLFTVGVNADIITVLNEAVKEGIFENSAAGKEYLSKLMQGVPSLSNIESYCKIVEEKYYIRSLITASRKIIENCTEGSESADLLLDYAEQTIYDIRQGREIDGLTKIDEVLLSAYDHLNRISGADREKFKAAGSGYVALDNLISGLNRSDLIILAARPGVGKSSFAMNIAANVCRSSPDTEVVVFSLEMSKEQLVSRMLAAESLVENDHLMKGTITSSDWEKLAKGADRMSVMNLYLDDTAGSTVPQIKAKVRRLKKPGLIIIDYLQLMNSGKRAENRVNEISEITRQLKLMAKELDVPVMTLSQLSRSVESRPDKRPLLSDLRESGSIEQDADIVMFLYREGYYNRDKAEDVNLAECIVAKNRHGSTGTINLRWNGQYTLFMSEDSRSYSDMQ